MVSCTIATQDVDCPAADEYCSTDGACVDTGLEEGMQMVTIILIVFFVIVACFFCSIFCCIIFCVVCCICSASAAGATAAQASAGPGYV